MAFRNVSFAIEVKAKLLKKLPFPLSGGVGQYLITAQEMVMELTRY